MAARSKARKRALDILFEAEMRRESPLSLLETRIEQADPPVSEYAADLVRGVQAHRAEIDGILAENSRGWSLERMPAVDRNILRIGAFELLWAERVPAAVAISEAVLLATNLSTDASPAFVNGLLARVLEIMPSLPRDATLRVEPGEQAAEHAEEQSGERAEQQSGERAEEQSGEQTQDATASADEAGA